MLEDDSFFVIPPLSLSICTSISTKCSFTFLPSLSLSDKACLSLTEGFAPNEFQIGSKLFKTVQVTES